MPSGPGRIHLSMDEVLLEGMRQQDELAALVGRAPERDEVLALAVDLAHLPEGLHPVTEEVLGLLELFRTAGEVVDNAKATDLEAMRALTTLVERGMVRVLGRAPAEGGGRRLVSPEVAYALHGREGGRASGRRQATLRLVVSAASPGDLRRLSAELSEIEGWKAEASGHVLEVGLGALGVLRLTEVLEVELMAVPADDSLSPLWRPFGAAAAGGLLLAEGQGAPTRWGRWRGGWSTAGDRWRWWAPSRGRWQMETGWWAPTGPPRGSPGSWSGWPGPRAGGPPRRALV